MRLNHDRGIDMYAIGVYQVDEGASWKDLTSASFDDLTADATLAAGLPFVEVSLLNTHASQSLYLLLQAGGAIAVAKAIEVKFGKSVDLSALLLAKAGASFLTISVRGAGANTTGQLVCGFASATDT